MKASPPTISPRDQCLCSDSVHNVQACESEIRNCISQVRMILVQKGEQKTPGQSTVRALYRSGFWVQGPCNRQSIVPPSPHLQSARSRCGGNTAFIFNVAFREGHVPEPHVGVGGWMARKSDDSRLGGGVGVLEVGPARPGGPTRHRDGDGDDGGGPRSRS